MDGVSGAYIDTLATHLAFVAVYICYVVGNRDGFKGALFGTLAATYAGSRAGLACYGTLFFVDTTYIYSASFGTFLAQFYDVSRASLYAGAAGRTLLYVYYGQPGSRIECECSELAGCHTIAASETSVGAGRLAAVKAVDDGAACGTFIDVYPRTVFACAVAAYHGNAGGGIGCLHSQYARYFFHDFAAAYRAEKPVERSRFYA